MARAVGGAGAIFSTHEEGLELDGRQPAMLSSRFTLRATMGPEQLGYGLDCDGCDDQGQQERQVGGFGGGHQWWCPAGNVGVRRAIPTPGPRSRVRPP
ncbi:hypothetical protein [Synechococcus sp. CCY 0621]|uniref:hypothetical protein n=1 Tax=Synechococcus sp. CCY 0621 TaxID=2815603 RepID=UPI001C2432FD|nr:hypothetical protein [Synechococcus sp. CCY 0621]